MRTRIVTAASGAALSLIFATCETFSAAGAITIPQPIRVWMVGTVIATVIVVAVSIVLERLRDIDTHIDDLAAFRATRAASKNPEQRADTDFEDYRRRLRTEGDVTYLYPEEP